MPGIRRLTEKGRGVGIVDVNDSNEEIIYCVRCMEIASVRSILGKRIYLPDESGKTIIPPDDDKWRQCYECGSIYARYQVKEEVRLSTLTEPSDNPFNTDEIKGIGDSRRFDRTGKTQVKKKKKQEVSEIKDEDVRREVAYGSTPVSYHESR